MGDTLSILNMGFAIPGEPLALRPLIAQSETFLPRLSALHQEFTHRSDVDSTTLALDAARSVISTSGVNPLDIELVITAPTLLSGYGLEIPAVAVRAQLNLLNAETLNLCQGCVGFLAGVRLAGSLLQGRAPTARALIATSCRASTLMDGFTHGGFYWGDGAAAAIVGYDEMPGWRLVAYAEASSMQNFDAMRIPFGDAMPFRTADPANDLRVQVSFPDARAQSDYIAGEHQRCTHVIKALLGKSGLLADDIEAVFIPSVGRNRVKLLFEDYPTLAAKIESDFRFAHMGGVDLPFFFARYLKRRPAGGSGHVLLLSPAFTAQWGGVLLSYSGERR